MARVALEDMKFADPVTIQGIGTFVAVRGSDSCYDCAAFNVHKDGSCALSLRADHSFQNQCLTRDAIGGFVWKKLDA